MAAGGEVIEYLGSSLGADRGAWIGLSVPGLLSGGLTRYATSGFENPLTIALLALQAAQILALRTHRELPWGRLFLVAGVLGGFTTFSTFGLETWTLVEDGAFRLAVANAIGSVVVGLVSVIAGVVIARQLG